VKQLLSIFLVILFAFPAWAQEGVITEIQKGQRAPFTGVLMDAKAAAKVLTDQKYTAEECKIELDREIEILRAKLGLDLKISEIKLNSANEKFGELIKIKDEENKRLQELALERPNDYTHWWFVGGAIGGTLLAIGIFSIAAEITN
jgi:hypothetical protein|tara:strand:+ start:38 stop:475 length:438 start_codon:yes stop_codon:yes gene_type:complete